MEISKTIETLAKVNESIESIAKVLQGTETLTSDTQAIATSLLVGETPMPWIALWDGPEAPLNWIRVINRKATALRSWVTRIQGGSLLNNLLNLNDLFHPETFLNALRQRAARELKYAINDLKLVSSFEKGKI